MFLKLLNLIPHSELFRAPEWTPTLLWNECNSPCDSGFETRMFACLLTDRFNSSTLVNEKKCGPLPSEDKLVEGETKRACDWGSCIRKTRWRASPWGVCSQPCGGNGVSMRDIECVMNGPDGDVVISGRYANSYCEPGKRPDSVGSCNKFSCPAEFTANPWNKVSVNLNRNIVFHWHWLSSEAHLDSD